MASRQRSQHRPPPSEQPSVRMTAASPFIPQAAEPVPLYSLKGRTGPRRLGKSNTRLPHLWALVHEDCRVVDDYCAARSRAEGCRHGTRKLSEPLVLGPMHECFDQSRVETPSRQPAASKTESALQFAFRRSELIAPRLPTTRLSRPYANLKSAEVRLALVTLLTVILLIFGASKVNKTPEPTCVAWLIAFV